MTRAIPRLRVLLSLLPLFAFSSLSWAGGAAPMTREDFKAAEGRIEAVANSERKACSRLQGRAAELCVVEAKAREKVAKAELQADYEPSLESWQDAREAKAAAEYEVARERCADLKGSPRDRCIRAAKSAREAAIRLAKVEKVEAMRAAKREDLAERKAALAKAKP